MTQDLIGINWGILNDYFKGKEIEPKDLGGIYEYRQYCLLRALKPLATYPSTAYSKQFSLLEKLDGRFYGGRFRESFFGKKVVELGPGMRPLAKKLLAWGISEYVGVEPFNYECAQRELPQDPKVSLVKEDGLTYLLKQEDDSCLVISFGVFCSEFYFFDNNDDYFKFMGKEVYRVTPKGGVTVHHPFLDLSSAYLRVYGFVPFEENEPTNLHFIWKKPVKT